LGEHSHFAKSQPEFTMAMTDDYANPEPTLNDIGALKGAAVIEFGTPWCGHCRAAQPLLTAAFTNHPSIQHIKIEDGSGRPLGRAFRVKLWPTLIFLVDGQEVSRLVRPTDTNPIREALTKIDAKN